MKDMGIVHGSAKQAVPLVIGYDTVYIHTDIEPATEEQAGDPVEGLFRYHEIQYPKDEYIRMMAESTIDNDTMSIDHEYRLTMLELGL